MIPAPSELRPCALCAKPVLWTLTAARKRLAVDPRPDPHGNQACYRAGGAARVWHSRSLDGADALPLTRWEHRFVPHVATCTGQRPRPVQPELPGLIVPPQSANVINLAERRRARR